MAYGPTGAEADVVALRRAHDLGVTFFDTAEMYGWGTGSNEILVGKAVRDFRDDVVDGFGVLLGVARLSARVDVADVRGFVLTPASRPSTRSSPTAASAPATPRGTCPSGSETLWNRCTLTPTAAHGPGKARITGALQCQPRLECPKPLEFRFELDMNRRLDLRLTARDAVPRPRAPPRVDRRRSWGEELGLRSRTDNVWSPALSPHNGTNRCPLHRRRFTCLRGPRQPPGRAS